jgi:GT2 family glycosyltransferase
MDIEHESTVDARLPGRTRVAAVIPAFNGEAVLAKCLDSLLSQTYQLSRIYVVDNNSLDDTVKVVGQHQSERIVYLQLNENIGPTGGFAHGMQAALDDKCDWVWLMDQDGTASADSLEKLLECAILEKEIVAVAPAKFEPGGTLWVGENVSGGVAPDVARYGGPAFEIDSTMWSGLLIRAQAIGQAGLPLTELFGWWCDGEYCFRLKHYGRIVLVPSSRIFHHRTGAVHLDYAGYWKHYYYQRNSMYLYLNGHLPSPGLSRMLLGLLKQVAYITLKQDHKRERLHILLTAAFHAFAGRMGRGPAWLH